MRAFDSLYEEPSFEEPSAKERSVFYAVVGAAVTIASTVAALQINSSTEWFSHASKAGTAEKYLAIGEIFLAHTVMRSYLVPLIPLVSKFSREPSKKSFNL
ncbi:hypothetical protein GY45DRAFT_1374248 [Cubamyces sp. BRFM 1775]|nr:hypothetical protein GY45DRAFT_1374248 [Cubamyces sp. BRFM 1775]